MIILVYAVGYTWNAQKNYLYSRLCFHVSCLCILSVLINVKRSISLVLPRIPSNRCMEPADLSSMVLPAGVQFVFNISKIQSLFKFPELVFLWGEEVIISNFCLTYLDPILLLKKLSIFI